MNKIFKQILQIILKYLSILILRKYHPQIIGITGSVGKTSAKEAIYTVLSKQYLVRKNIKNYNNEIGVPLTIIGASSGYRSGLRWLRVLLKASRLLIWRMDNYPQILVLEMGADHPGDIQYLLSFIKCHIGVLTTVSESHLEYFGDIGNVAVEKRNIISQLAKSDFAVINMDNEKAWQQKIFTKASVYSYGENVQALIRASDLTLMHRQNDFGLNFKLYYQGTVVPMFLPQIISHQQVSAILVGVAVGLIFNMNLVQIGERVNLHHSTPGRTKYIPGVKGTHIIDDSYNSSPIAVIAALSLLIDLPIEAAGKKWIVLGDMLELGQISESAHQEIGAQIASRNIDYLITFGERARDIARGARNNGMTNDRIYSFNDHYSISVFLQDRIKNQDIILIKGSQGMRMEKIVKEIMAEPERAHELLVRQDKEWLK